VEDDFGGKEDQRGQWGRKDCDVLVLGERKPKNEVDEKRGGREGGVNENIKIAIGVIITKGVGKNRDDRK